MIPLSDLVVLGAYLTLGGLGVGTIFWLAVTSAVVEPPAMHLPLSHVEIRAAARARCTRGAVVALFDWQDVDYLRVDR